MHIAKKIGWLGFAKIIVFGLVIITVLAFLNSIAIVHVLFVVGGAYVAGLALDRKRSRQAWARGALAIAGIALLLVGSVELALHSEIWKASAVTRSNLNVIIWTSTGLVLGLLLALLISGELEGRKVSSDSTRAL